VKNNNKPNKSSTWNTNGLKIVGVVFSLAGFQIITFIRRIEVQTRNVSSQKFDFQIDIQKTLLMSQQAHKSIKKLF